MIPGLGKEVITLGSAPDNDVVLQGPGVAPHHARIVKQGAALSFVDLGRGAVARPTARPLAAAAARALRLPDGVRARASPVPLAHPAIALMLMSPGQLQAPRGQVIVGRDASRASLVIAHAAVSGAARDGHARPHDGRRSRARRAARGSPASRSRRTSPPRSIPTASSRSAPCPSPCRCSCRSPRPRPRAWCRSKGRRCRCRWRRHRSRGISASERVRARQSRSPGQATGQPDGAQSPRAKHRTVIGELSLDQLQSSAISIGRTPDNQIVVTHPQVSLRSTRRSSRQGERALPRGPRLRERHVRPRPAPRPGQRVPVQNGEKVFIGPMPLLIHIAESQVNVVVEDQAEWAGKPLYEIEAWDLFLEVPDRDDKGQMKMLLDHVSLQGAPGGHDRAHGPVGRRQDDAAPHAQRLPAADERAGAHQRRGPLHSSTTRSAAASATSRRTTSSTPSSPSSRR